jgi:hypothetical protein
MATAIFAERDFLCGSGATHTCRDSIKTKLDYFMLNRESWRGAFGMTAEQKIPAYLDFVCYLHPTVSANIYTKCTSELGSVFGTDSNTWIGIKEDSTITGHYIRVIVYGSPLFCDNTDCVNLLKGEVSSGVPNFDYDAYLKSIGGSLTADGARLDT